MNKDYVLIKAEGTINGVSVSPENCDIRDLREFFEIAEKLIFPDQSSSERPRITCKLSEGSLCQFFYADSLPIGRANAALRIAASGKHLDTLHPHFSEALARMVSVSRKQDIILNVSTSEANSPHLIVNKDTSFVSTRPVMTEIEHYIAGTIENYGGVSPPNIHLRSYDDGVTYIIKATRDQLKEISDNPVYQSYSARVLALQNVATGEIQANGMKLIELWKYEPFKMDKAYMQDLEDKAEKSWEGVDAPVEWVRNLRGVVNE